MSKQGDIFRAADGTMRRRPPLAGLLPVYSSMAPERPVREKRFQYFSLADWSRVDKDATADLSTCLAERVCRAARCDYRRHFTATCRFYSPRTVLVRIKGFRCIPCKTSDSRESRPAFCSDIFILSRSAGLNNRLSGPHLGDSTRDFLWLCSDVCLHMK